MEAPILSAVLPVILLLALGVVTVIVSKAVRLGPIVGYLLLGVALSSSGLVQSSDAVHILAELGVVFLLFDVGLHFSPRHLRDQVVDVFAFGPVQVAACTLGLGPLAIALGMPAAPAFFVGATLSLSSTAVVARIIADRHQQSCPVGMAATGILVFQDLAAIFLLIIASALSSGAALLPALAIALVKAAASFAAAMILARFLVRPVFDLVAQTRNEEVFTAMALLVALTAGWVTGTLGLSLTLGAFLGGMMLADTPYRAIVQSEIKPFRGLLLGFFFISVGLSLQIALLQRLWPLILVVSLGLVAAKVALNGIASLVFRWSVPGSLQLGFLLAQSSEFALVIFSLSPVRAMVGADRSDVLIAAVVLSLGATPHLASLGRSLAGRLRHGRLDQPAQELQARDLTGPVFIVGMGPRGRTVADALHEFEIRYAAIETDAARLRRAIADGYHVVFGDLADPRIWEPFAMQDRRISVLTMPSFEYSADISPVAHTFYPGLTRMAVVDTPAEAAQYAAIGVVPVVDVGHVPGLEAAAAVLHRLELDAEAITAWIKRQTEKAALQPDGDDLVGL
ncbi:potassium transporter KefB [Sphingomonas sp. AP4-R1]|uniref:cation:proton antiporter domain-containing protein n=1 Tax=Sphingomonas sp. AP4-R1 TaxID=2735134 RepID=UPI00149358CE|nr:cation:proton antiporter [Sphingomonas sp. AP4-R1]QJU60139.1 potassium transporter KefB [Sphingomonas sp. AP4-R1]